MNYTQYTELSENYILQKFNEFLKEDNARHDLTSLHTIPIEKTAIALMLAEEDMIFAGECILKTCINEFATSKKLIKDSTVLKNGDLIVEISGLALDILSHERVLLNLIQRLCGIATLTNKYVEIAKPYNVKILDTRKTTPGLRMFEKYAVTCGGGFNHRLDLQSGILIKDNHITAAGGIENAINNIRKADLGLNIELEVDKYEQINEALSIGVDGFLIDNFTPEDCKKAVEIIRNSPNGEKYFIEASGGINLTTLGEYVKTGIDAVSIGALTHSAVNKSIHLEFE